MKDQFLIEDFIEKLQKYITFYCKRENINYKQGLNEVIGPIFLIKSKIPEVSIPRLYNFSVMFIYTFIYNFYHQLELYPLRIGLSLVKLLAKYHLPDLMNLFEYSLVTTEMFATSWLLTLFAR
jgi:hypothetical protein